jgi:hypothetical protein
MGYVEEKQDSIHFEYLVHPQCPRSLVAIVVVHPVCVLPTRRGTVWGPKDVFNPSAPHSWDPVHVETATVTTDRTTEEDFIAARGYNMEVKVRVALPVQ